MRNGRWVALVMVLCVGAGGCDLFRPANGPAGLEAADDLEVADDTDMSARAHDFFGLVSLAELGGDWSVQPASIVWATGAPDGQQTWVGPATLHMVNGSVLDVPDRTPGGNACPDLVRPEDLPAITGIETATRYDQIRGLPAPSACVLIGGLSDERTVSWFEVLTDVRADGGEVWLQDTVELLNGTALVRQGTRLFRFPVAAQVEIKGCDSLELTSIEDTVSRRPGMHSTVVDTTTGEVVAVECLWDE